MENIQINIKDGIKLHIIPIYTNAPSPIPKKPAIYARSININLETLIWNPNPKSGTAKEAIPVIATIIINIGLTTLALTAAWPKTSAPTIPYSRAYRRWNS